MFDPRDLESDTSADIATGGKGILSITEDFEGCSCTVEFFSKGIGEGPFDKVQICQSVSHCSTRSARYQVVG